MKLKEKEKFDNEDVNVDQEGARVRKSGAWNVAKDKGQPYVSAERVQSYEEAFNKIQAATGIQEIDELVDSFIRAEEKNFTLFKFVNELNNEIENVET